MKWKRYFRIVVNGNPWSLSTLLVKGVIWISKLDNQTYFFLELVKLWFQVVISFNSLQSAYYDISDSIYDTMFSIGNSDYLVPLDTFWNSLVRGLNKNIAFLRIPQAPTCDVRDVTCFLKNCRYLEIKTYHR